MSGPGRRIRAKSPQNDRSLTQRVQDSGKIPAKRPESMAAERVKQHSGTKMLPYGTRGKGQVAFRPQNAAIWHSREGLSSITAPKCCHMALAGRVKQHSGTKMLPYGTRRKGQVAFQPQNAAIRHPQEELSSITAPKCCHTALAGRVKQHFSPKTPPYRM